MGQGFKYINIIYIKSMLRQCQLTVAQKSGTENHRMHQYIMPLGKMMAIVPGKQLPRRKNMTIMHYLLPLLPLFFIYKIADKHIQCTGPPSQFPQGIKNLQIRLFLHPVVAVHNLEIQSFRIPNPCIDGGAMSSVLLMNRFDNRGILLGIFLCNPGRPVFGTVVHDNDFHILAARQQRFDAFSHICLRIIAGDRYR